MSDIVEVIAKGIWDGMAAKIMGDASSPSPQAIHYARAALSALEAEGWVVVRKDLVARVAGHAREGQAYLSSHYNCTTAHEVASEAAFSDIDQLEAACPPSLIVGG